MAEGTSARFGRKNRQNQRLQQSNSSMSNSQPGRSRDRSGGCPPRLKGKEIGLYYRNEALKKKKKANTCFIQLAPKVKQRMRTAIVKYEQICDLFWKEEAEKNRTNSKLADKYTHVHDSMFKRKFLQILSGNIDDILTKTLPLRFILNRDSALDESLLDDFKEKQSSNVYKTMQTHRKKLPVYDKRLEILDLIKNNQVVVISGETGCGKTTQIAQYILDDEIENGNGSITKVICTQPRRITAISVAERVAAERAERLGNSVGFQIRLEKVPARNRGSISFCTTGMLLQFIQHDAALRGFSHIILDEIHERSIHSDFVITLLKQVIPVRPDLKVILMSATLNSETFSKYYNDCPIIHIPGFTYPVEEFYLEDVLLFTRFRYPENSISDKQPSYKRHQKNKEKMRNYDFLHTVFPYTKQLMKDGKYPKFVIDQLCNPESEDLCIELIEALIDYICRTKEDGAILVFLPGMMDIVKLNRIMLDSHRYPSSKYYIYSLHSRMPTIDQRLIFKEPPKGVRKIIIATSIAETSITIEDVVYVIDCGKTKLSKFDVNDNMETLEYEWVSLANAKQRRGRAGRVQPGVCYHLYSRAREARFEQYPLPEMLRTRLEEVILQIKILQLGKAKQFLANVMDPPNMKAIDLSVDLLKTLNALDDDEHLTPLGYHLAQLPLNPRIGKMIIWASLFSCVDPILGIAANLAFKDAFYCPLGEEQIAMDRKFELSSGQYSDHIAFAEALKRFEDSYRKHNFNFCREYFLSYNTLKLLSEMKRQFAQHLCEMKFLNNDNPSDERANRNSENISLIKAIVCVGLYPNVATITATTRNGVIARTAENEYVKLHPSSVNSKMNFFPSPYLTYFTKQRSTAIYLHDTSCVTGQILLFAGKDVSINYKKNKYIITISTGQQFICDLATAKIIQSLRNAINNLLEYRISHPGTTNWDGHEGEILNAIIKLVEGKHKEVSMSEESEEESEEVDKKVEICKFTKIDDAELDWWAQNN